MSRPPSGRLFINTATVINPTANVETGTGARLPSFGSGTSYSCSIQPKTAEERPRHAERLDMGRDADETLVTFYFPAGTTVAGDAQITSNGITYRAIGPGRNGAGVNTYVRVDAVTEAISNV